MLRLYRRQNHRSSLAFLRELTAAFPFQIRKIQVDNGTEFPLNPKLRSRALPKATLYGLQNLHPRFKSGRRLQNPYVKSRDRGDIQLSF